MTGEMISTHTDGIADRDATQQDVARFAGVDRATVSRALDPNRQHLLSHGTVARVQSAAAALGYRPNTLARGLRQQRSHIVGLSIPPAARDQSSDFVEGAEERLRCEGFALVVSFDEEARLLRASNGLLDGAIVVKREAGDPAGRPRFGPVVSVGFEPADGLDVMIDLSRGIHIAVEHLGRLGHRRIALLAEPESTYAGTRYRRSFGDAIEELVPGATPQIATFLPRRPASVAEACHELLARPERPTALVVMDDAVASGCYGVARALGVDVPGDLSIVGFGDMGIGDFLVPSLTTVAVPARPAGKFAADAVLRRIRGESQGPRTFTPHLIHRASTGRVLP